MTHSFQESTQHELKHSHLVNIKHFATLRGGREGYIMNSDVIVLANPSLVRVRMVQPCNCKCLWMDMRSLAPLVKGG